MCMCMLNRQSLSLNKRVHILFDKDLWNKTTKLAKSQKVSVGEVIRGALKVELEKHIELDQSKQTPFNRFFKANPKR